MLFAADWSNAWNLIEVSRSPQAAATASVAVLDDESKASLFGQQSTLIFLGQPKRPERYFLCIPSDEAALAEALFKAVKKAFAYRETTLQNIESLYPNMEGGDSLEAMACSLGMRMQELQRLSDMRLAIIEQMPAGMIGIDDEGIVVLANPMAVQLLAMEDVPLWGMEIGRLLNGKLAEFIEDKAKESLEAEVCGQALSIRKSSFALEKGKAGTILVILRQSASQKAG